MPWSPTPAAPPTRAGRWTPRPVRHGVDQGGGEDYALVEALTATGRDDAGGGDLILMTADPEFDLQIRTQGRDNALGDDLALVDLDVGHVLDAGAGGDLARLGLYGLDDAGGADHALVGPGGYGRDQAGAADRVLAGPGSIGRDHGGAGDKATGWFSPHAATVATFTTVGNHTYTIPVWCRFIDLIVLGGGGGGGGGNAALSGTGGTAGSFAWITLERGVHIPWTATSFTVTVGGGGGGGTGNIFVGIAGSPGTATSINYGAGTVTGSGGAAGGGGNGGARTGKAVTTGNTNGNKDLALNGQTYVGGGTSTGAGSPPGGGGYGGQSSNGQAGATGRAWACARFS